MWYIAVTKSLTTSGGVSEILGGSSPITARGGYHEHKVIIAYLIMKIASYVHIYRGAPQKVSLSLLSYFTHFTSL